MSKSASPLTEGPPRARDARAGPFNPDGAPDAVGETAATLLATPEAFEWLEGVQASTRKGRDCVLKVLEAAKSVLVSHGYANLTLRLVAERAAIAHSNVQYYFPTKEKLVENLMIYISLGYRNDIRKLFETISDDPMQRFVGYIRFYVNDISKASVTIIFAELRAMSHRSAFILDTLDGMYVRYRLRVEGLLGEINPALPAGTRTLRAALIVSLIDGLMIFVGGDNARHAALAELAAEAEREILRIATAPA